eukprot:6192371-Pleurochrysis_carterae.AAC.1
MPHARGGYRGGTASVRPLPWLTNSLNTSLESTQPRSAESGRSLSAKGFFRGESSPIFSTYTLNRFESERILGRRRPLSPFADDAIVASYTHTLLATPPSPQPGPGHPCSERHSGG